jgi:tRNA U34 2-thiouridine synthase MnmA/TrmU
MRWRPDTTRASTPGLTASRSGARAIAARTSRIFCSVCGPSCWRACGSRSATWRKTTCARLRGAPACPTPTSPTRSRSADSQQICFIPDGDHVGFVTAHGGAGAAGTIVDDTTGAPIGKHEGTHAFTVGQRRGVPGGGAGPRFVLRIDASTGEVRVGPRDRLGRDQLRVTDVRWLDPRAAEAPELRCAVQIRHHAAAAPAWIAPADDGATLVRLDEPAYGVAPGQAAVFYDRDDRVLGGGWIQ